MLFWTKAYLVALSKVDRRLAHRGSGLGRYDRSYPPIARRRAS